MEATSSVNDRSLFSQRDVTIDRSKLQIGTMTWPLDKLGKLEKQQPPFELPPRKFLIGGGIALLIALFAGGFLGFVLFVTGVGANVWWFLTQRPYSLVINTTAGALIAGKWTGKGASEFVDEVVKKVEDTKRRIEVRRRMLSEKHPFARFGSAIEARFERLESRDSFEHSNEFSEFAEATIDAISEDSSLSSEMLDLGLGYVVELVSIATEKLSEKGGIISSDADASGDHSTRALEAESAYEQGFALLGSDDGDTKLQGLKLLHRATEIDPNHLNALITLGKAFLALDKNDKKHERLAIAITLGKRAVRVDPSDLRARNLLWAAHIDDGRRHWDSEQWSDAFESYKEALIVDPQSFFTLASLEHVGNQANRKAEVNEVLIALSSKSPPFDAKSALTPEAKELLESAKELGRNGNWSDAFDTCIRSLDVQASVDAWLMLVVIADKTSRLEKLHEIKMKFMSKFVVDD